jgi:ATP:ADP antiporter, AAA family
VSATAHDAAAREPSALERLLAHAFRPFAKVEPSETVSTAVLMLTVFLVLTAYYLLKTAREPLILLHGGAEVKSYAAAGQAVLLLFVVQAYGAVARRVGRMKLLAIVYLFFVSNLLLFAALAAATSVPLGVPFYLWVGIFNATAIAQFWALAADVYTPEQGKRLFAVLGIGSSVGAVAGARIAKALVGLGPQGLMLGAAVILVVCVLMLVWVGRHAQASRPEARADQSAPAASEAPLASENAYRLLIGDRYLLLIAVLTLLLNWVNSNGEYLLDRTLLAAIAHGQANGDATAFIGAFKADYFGWVNLVGVLLQLFLVSRVLERGGVRNALFVLPVVAFASYSVMAFAPVLALIRIGKIAENSLDYSIQNTARQALYLVTTRVEKYVGKTAVDTLFVRLGDLLSAAAVWLGARFALSTPAFAGLNLALITLWIGTVFAIGREHARRGHEASRLASLEPVGT